MSMTDTICAVLATATLFVFAVALLAVVAIVLVTALRKLVEAFGRTGK